jgi:LDH2 family malate/lactate/ureidoglycolate dehydrogenase/3-hydroxyisobutyrate dehydrogenase-like beta-hydroxyacid dehydrogenase
MGLPLGRRLLAAGHELVVCELDPGRAAALGVPVAPTPAGAFATAEVAVTSLPSVEAIEEVVLGRGGLLSGARPGTTVIEMSTSSPALARRLAAALEAQSVDVLDAPVSGGPRGAEAGTLTIMVGGRAPVFARQRELLGCMGTPVHVGGHGAGQTLKLCNNLLAGCAMAALAEACALATGEGIDPETLYDVLASSTGDSRVLRTRFPIPGVDPLHPATNDYRPLFGLDLLVKDMSLALGLAGESGVAAPVAAAALAAYREAQQEGLGSLDYSAVYLARGSGNSHGSLQVPPRAPTSTSRSSTAGGRFPERLLREFGETVLVRYGAARPAAAIVLDCLVEADRRGVHTHGLIRLPSYCAQARAGEIAADAEPAVVHEEGPTSLVDGRLAFGAVTGIFSIDDAVRRASEFGVGATAVRNGTHFGSAAHYSLRAARAGLIGIVATNTPAAMAPWGGSEARLGNNPISIAGPMPDGLAPFALDIAQSATSRGRIKLAQLDKEPIPETWALDAGGEPTTDPAAALTGALLPAGGHKGSGLALAVELITGALAGAGISPRLVNTGLTGDGTAASEAERGLGYLFVVLDPGRFAGRELLLSRMGDLVDALKATRLAPGFSEILIPGEPEHRTEAAAESEGVDLPAATVDALESLAAAEGLPFPAS